MLNGSINNFFTKWRYVIYFIVTGLLAFSTRLSFLIPDSNNLFHEGEYTGLLWNMREYYEGVLAFPLIIHGAMDYIPAIISLFLHGSENIIVGTRGINTIITWICWIIFLDLCYTFVSKNSNRLFYSLVSFCILFLLTPSLHQAAITVQQAFIGTRDLFLLATTLCFAKYWFELSHEKNSLLLIGGGVFATASLFWSYDRGLIALAFFTINFLGLIYQKKYLDTLYSLIGVLLTSIVISKTNIFGSFQDNFVNIYYWIKNAAEVFGTGTIYNSSGLTDISMIITTFSLLLFCLASIIMLFAKNSPFDKNHVFIMIGMIAIQILLLKTVLNRPGMPRTSWAIWPSILFLLYYLSNEFSNGLNIKINISNLNKKINFKSKIYILMACFIIFVMNGSSFNIINYGSFAKNIIKPKLDSMIVSSDVMKLSKYLANSSDRCIFGWVNEGIISMLTKKSFCTKYQYAIYVSNNEEEKFLQDLKNNSPKNIVFDNSESFTMNLDDKKMSQRLPRINQYIKDNYKNSITIGTYIVVSK